MKKYQYLLAIPFLVATIYHLVGILIPSIVEPSPWWRHALFIVINSLLIVLIFKKITYFGYALALLCLQQFYSHGEYMYRIYKTQDRIDWYSVITLVALSFLPLLYKHMQSLNNP